jgi:PIN domain nuclease of toxin-antitoxin system
MRALLDTHTFLWWVHNDPRLSDQVREIIGDGSNTLYLSAASGWEIAIKAQLGKLQFSSSLDQFIAEQLTLNGIDTLPIALRHVLHVATLPPHHRDPFDRILVAQCQLEQLPMLTADAQITKYAIQTIW